MIRVVRVAGPGRCSPMQRARCGATSPIVHRIGLRVMADRAPAIAAQLPVCKPSGQLVMPQAIAIMMAAWVRASVMAATSASTKVSEAAVGSMQGSRVLSEAGYQFFSFTTLPICHAVSGG